MRYTVTRHLRLSPSPALTHSLLLLLTCDYHEDADDAHEDHDDAVRDADDDIADDDVSDGDADGDDDDGTGAAENSAYP